jgi:hypothetical protein
MDKQTDFNFSDGDKVVGGNFHNFSEQKEVIGILEKMEDGTFGKQYTIRTPQDEIISIGSFSALQSKLSESAVGHAVKIVFLGEKKSKNGRLYKDFDVFIK